MIDVGTLTFAGFVTIGVVNVVTFFEPNLKSEFKWFISLVVAFGLTFVPAYWGSIFMEHLRQALQIAFAASGGYKLTQNIGGK